MSATLETLQPRDNAELLHASAGFRASRGRGERARAGAKRDLLLCLTRARVLVAATAEQPLRRPGPDGGVLLAFTDSEATDAWEGMQLPAAGDHDGFTALPDAATSSERDGRRLWLELFERCDAVAVVVNPAGPLGFAAYRAECEAVRPGLRRARVAQAHDAWLDVFKRARERARVEQLTRALAEAIQSHDGARFERLRPELEPLNRFGSPATAATTEVLSGRWRLELGELEDGMYQLLWGAYAWGRYVGDPYRCIDLLLQGGALLERLLDADGEGNGDWAENYLRELADVLASIAVGYREEDRVRFARWRTDSGSQP